MRLVVIVPALAALLASSCNNPGQTNTAVASSASPSEASCYAKAAKYGIATPGAENSLFVVVDQTTGLDKSLRGTVQDNVTSLLQPGTTFTIYSFADGSSGHYLMTVLSGDVEAPVPDDQRSSLSVRRLSQIDRCLKRQSQTIQSNVAGALRKTMRNGSSEFENSQILGSLAQVSSAVASAPGADKLVFIVSDMLEHSSTTSFYSKKQLRSIDPDSEMSKVKKDELTGDFGGASVAVVGAGLLGPAATSGARNNAALSKLQDFWKMWFDRSHANVVA